MTLWGNGSKTKPTVSSKYGPRSGGAFSTHFGTDFVGYTKLYAILGGTVTAAGWLNSAAGNAIVIDTVLPNGQVVTICHFHVGTISVKKGAKVREGAYLGEMGSTGNATGKCDHVEIRFWKNGSYTTVDPEVWIGNRIRSEGSPAPTTPPPSSGSNKTPWNPFGIAFCSGLQKIANLYGAGTEIDQTWGPKSAKGFAEFLRRHWGYKGNDELGPVMWAAIARWLRSKWGYVGNDTPGPVMRAALQRAETANFRELK